jgi:serine/threonine-protein kinase
MDTDRNLLFGVLALQADLLDAAQFAEACSAWAGRKEVPLADLLVQRGWLTDEDRSHVEYLLRRSLRKHGDNARQSLAGLADGAVRDVLRSLDDPGVQQTVSRLPPAPNYVLLSTVAHNLGQRARYTLTRVHGEGGLGRVYVAHDRDLNRDVALKELRAERAQNPETWRRFFREAQLTGQLEHPNIVPVYEVGSRDEDGQPFYTMRLVQGRTLREALRDYHQRRAAGRTDPLEWPKLLHNFVSICNAVGYAHSRGVVHRDLKPENVMLGGFGEVIVLDWGLAKVVGQPEEAADQPAVALTEPAQVEATMAGRMLGTPAYAAPEQAEGRIDLIDARTDVYGLGAIFFELLTGKPPHAAEDTAAVLRQIATAATPRARDANPAVAPSLDAVCARAMARDRGDRYPRAEDLARDVERWLADEPVTAYREPLSARLWRRARRHRALVTSSAVLLAVGLLFVSVLAFLLEGARERTERARAQAEADFREAEEQRARADHNFRQARKAVDDYFTRVSENKLLGLPHLEPLRKELLEKAREYYEQFSREAADDPKVRADHATAVFRVATILELTGAHEEARGHYATAVGLYRAVLADAPDAPADWRYKLGVCLADYSVVQMEDGNMDEAARLLEQSRATLEALVADKPGEVKFRAALGRAYLNTGLWHDKVGQTEECLRAYEKCRALQEQVVADDPGRTESRADLALTVMNLGSFHLENGQPDKALALYEEVRRMVEPLVRAHTEAIYYQRLLGAVQHNVGMLHRLMSRVDPARAAYEEARRIRARLAEEHPAVTDYQNDLGETLNNIGELQLARRQKAEAFTTLKHAGDVFQAVAAGATANAKYRSALALAHNNIGVVLHQTEKYAEALAEHQKALALREQLAGENPRVVDYQAHLADTYSNLANTLRSLGRNDEALAYYRKSCAGYEPLAARQATTTRYRTNLALAYTNMGFLHEEAERFEEARAAYEKGLALREELLAVNPQVPRFQSDVAQGHFYVGRTLTRLGFPRYRTAFAATLAAAPAGPFGTLACLSLPPDETEYHYAEEALQAYNRALAIQARLPGVSEPDWQVTDAASLVAAGAGSGLGTLAWAHRSMGPTSFPDYRADLGRTYIQIGNVYRDGKKLLDAFSWEKKAVMTYQQLADEVPADDEFRNNLAVSYANWGMTLQDMRLALAAQAQHEKGRALREQLVKAHPDNKDYRRNLAESYNSLGIATLSLRRRDAALDWFRKAEAGFRGLVDQYPDDARYRSDFARAILNEGITFIEMGKPLEALPYLERSLPLQRQAMEQRPGRYRFRELVGKTYGQLAVAHAALGQVAEARAAVAERRGLWRWQAEPLVDLAVDLGKCITQVGNGKEKLTEAEEAARREYADLAMDALREARALGFSDLDRLRTETKLEPLRQRKDFNELLTARP